jgi:CheY-like chemotaxis protein
MSARILYIEDNESNLYLVTFLLQTRGHSVVQARDGAEGLALALAERPDLILLDIQLPDLDGYETARLLRSEPASASTPIIALTSYAMAGDREKALAAGCTGYIEKPINPDTFIATIERFLPAAP